MFNLIVAKNADEAFSEAFWKMKVLAEPEGSRNGQVMTSPYPVGFCLTHPNERVLMNADRDANPFFHVMEAVWMFGGFNEVHLLEPYNKNYTQYAEDDGYVHGAYGHRWEYHFDTNQILQVQEILDKDPTSRRAVIGMWDPTADLNMPKRDVPCNTHIYFRVVDDALDMTVCNRSNDLVWGMLGANIVHMTMLQELLARQLRRRVGAYRVFTNNLHVYEQHWHWLDNPPLTYTHPELPYPLLHTDEDIRDFTYDCKSFFLDPHRYPKTDWIADVARPMRAAWEHRTDESLARILCPQWRAACTEWVKRRRK